MPISAQAKEGLDSLHDRISQIHDALNDLRHKIARIDGAPDGDGDSDVDDASPKGPPLAAVDPDAEEQLCADISDRLRDVRSDYDVVVEDALDLGWFVSADRRKQEQEADLEDEEEEATLHATTATAAVERARLSKALARTDRAITQTRRTFRATRTSGLLRKQCALREQVFEELETYDGSEASDSEASGEESEVDDDDDVDNLTPPPKYTPRHTPSPPSAEASAAAELTAALRQTHARIVGEVTRSDFAAQTLEESSRALAELGDRYSSSATGMGDIHSGLKAARGMVRGLLAAQKSDTWYLQMSVYVLASTVTWLLFRRLLYGPLWLLVWWPVRSALGTAVWVGKTGASVGGGMAGGGGNMAGSGSSMGIISMVSVPAADVSYSSSVPTAGTGTAQAEVYATASSASSSLVEQVGRVVDEAATALSVSASASASTTDEPQATDAPNPMKRMWQEDVEAAKYEEQQRQEKAAQDSEKEAEAAGKGKEKEEKEEEKEKEKDEKDEL